MKLKRKHILVLVLCMVLTLLLCSCDVSQLPFGRSASSEPEASAETEGAELEPEPEPEPETVLSEADQRIQELTDRLYDEMLSQEELMELAELYAQNSQVRLQRDMLELCVGRYSDESAYNMLQTLTVDLAEEGEQAQAAAERLMMCLSAEDDTEAYFALADEDIEELLPRIAKGMRTYYYASESVAGTLVLQIGYEGEQTFAKGWYQLGDEISFVQLNGDEMLCVHAVLSDGLFNGPFVAWYVNAKQGYISKETGTLEGNMLTGEYYADVAVEELDCELEDLWQRREETETTRYVGNFSQTGETQVEQIGDELREITLGKMDEASQVIYAISEAEDQYLFMNVAAGTDPASVRFDTGLIGLEAMPDYQTYTPVCYAPAEGGLIEADELKFRVFDGVLEYYDGIAWSVIGLLDCVEGTDPIRAHWEQNPMEPVVQDDNSDGEDPDGTSGSEPEATERAFAVSKAFSGIGNVAANSDSNPQTSSGNESSGGSSSGSGGNSGANGGSNSGSGSGSGGSSGGDSGSDSGAGGGSDSGSGTSGGENNTSEGSDTDVEWTNDFL